jgi:adenosylhomocysteine nucleosidase
MNGWHPDQNSGIFAGRDIGSLGNATKSFNGGRQESFRDHATRIDIGVLTVLAEETRAVVDAFQRTSTWRRQTRHGWRTHRATFATPHGALDAVLMQALARGPRSTAVASGYLVRRYRPSVVALVGIAGGIDPDLRVGDVVIADQVVYYDERRICADGVHRRGEANGLPREMTLAVNDFFGARGEPLWLPSPAGGMPFRVVRGGLGSGAAVISDRDSDIRRYLRTFDEKCRVVETEAGGLVQAIREDLPGQRGPVRWLVVRGISDHADEAKGHRDHDLAAQHAAAALVELLPFLPLRGE